MRLARVWADDALPPAAQTEQLPSGALEEGFMDLNLDQLRLTSSSSDFTADLQMLNVGVQTRVNYPPVAADAEE